MHTNTHHASTAILATPHTFSHATKKPLRPYQQHVAQAILRSVTRAEGNVYTVMFARQMGKNETSAQLEAYLMTLYAGHGGSIVKAAPSFKPQIVTSILRLKTLLEVHPLTKRRWRPAFGYMLRLGNATTTFLSADRNANVVGATASLLLEIDEAQNVDPDKYDRDFRPMASSTNATTVLYGTAWAEDSLLERQRQLNLKHQLDTGEQLHFEYDWTTLAAINPAYKAFVEAEIVRLGEEHPSIQTQYLLHTMSDAGRLFSAHQRDILKGTHPRTRTPQDGRTYVCGIDVAGEDEQAADAQSRLLAPKKDSTVVTIADVTRTPNGSAHIAVVDHIWWTGRDTVWQFENLIQFHDQWNFAYISVDASGIGRGLADFLEARFQPQDKKRGDRVEKFIFSAPAKSRLAYDMLAAINTNRLSIYADDHSPESTEFWHEVKACRYWLRANEIIGWAVPETEGHDDFVVSLALCCRAAELLTPAPASSLIRPQPDQDHGEW